MNRYQNEDMEIDETLKELEREFHLSFTDYDVQYPNEEQMMMTIEQLRPLVPQKKKSRIAKKSGASNILKRSVYEFFYISPIFWGINGLFLIIFFLAALVGKENPYHLMIILAPLPMLTGLFEVLKSRQDGMEELERSFLFSFQEIILSRLFITGAFNLVINMILTAFLSLVYPQMELGKLLLSWITPFTLITALSFLIVNRLRNIYMITAWNVIWIGCGFISVSSFMDKLEDVPVSVYVMIIVVAILCILGRMMKMYKGDFEYEAVD